MTIIQPLRRPGHVSMELRFFPAHTGFIQRLPVHPKADCHSPYKLNTLEGAAAPWPHRASEFIYLVLFPSLDQSFFQPLLHWAHLLNHPLQFPTTGPDTAGRSQDSTCHRLAPYSLELKAFR